MAYAPFLSFVILLLSSLSAWALESDRNQSVLVEADEVEIDFTNGKRIYTGNVSVRQGTIRIIADQIELFHPAVGGTLQDFQSRCRDRAVLHRKKVQFDLQ